MAINENLTASHAIMRRRGLPILRTGKR